MLSGHLEFGGAKPRILGPGLQVSNSLFGSEEAGRWSFVD